MAAAPFLSCFEVEVESDAHGEGTPAAEGQGETTGPEGGSLSLLCLSLWLAGDVEAFNIPGTVTSAGGLRFMPSCYQWQ